MLIKTFAIDRTGDLTLSATNVANDEGISGVEIYLKGGRTIGNDPDTLFFDDSDLETTDSDGSIVYENLGYGTYEIMNIEELDTGGFSFVGTSETHPFQLTPGEELGITLMFATSNINALFVTITDSGTSLPIEGAEVQVTGTSFDQTALTGSDGNAYFPITEDPINTGTYQINVQAIDYQNNSTSETVSGFTRTNISLNPNI